MSAGDRFYKNPTSNKDTIFTVNKGGVETEVARLNGTSGTLGLRTGYITVTNANYTILDTDGYHTIFVSTGASNRTITLPSAATNAGRTINFKKIDAGAGQLIISRAGSDTIDGATTQTIYFIYGLAQVISDGTNWYLTGAIIEVVQYIPTASNTSGISTGPTGFGNSQVIRVNNYVTVDVAGFSLTLSTGAGTVGSFDLSLPIPSNFTLATDCNGVVVGSMATTGNTIGGNVTAQTTNDAASVVLRGATTTSANVSGLHFMYLIK